jgi:hypothetical protein
MSGKSKRNAKSRQRVLQAVLVKRVMAEFKVSHVTACKWLRSRGPAPCSRISRQAVYFWQDEADRWLAGLQS